MNREDFKVDQTVYILLIGNAAVRKTDEERVIEGKVVSVGRKYITVEANYREIKFDITDDFKEKSSYGGRDYELHLSEEEIFYKLRKNEMTEYIKEVATEWGNKTLKKISDEELSTIYNILKKYEE